MSGTFIDFLVEEMHEMNSSFPKEKLKNGLVREINAMDNVQLVNLLYASLSVQNQVTEIN